jgi:hypothetical protein
MSEESERAEPLVLIPEIEPHTKRVRLIVERISEIDPSSVNYSLSRQPSATPLPFEASFDFEISGYVTSPVEWAGFACDVSIRTPPEDGNQNTLGLGGCEPRLVRLGIEVPIEIARDLLWWFSDRRPTTKLMQFLLTQVVVCGRSSPSPGMLAFKVSDVYL